MSFRVVKTRHQVRVPDSATLTAGGIAVEDPQEVLTLKAAALLGAAEEEARALRERAEAEAELRYRDAYQEGFEAGRREGIAAAREEAKTALSSLEEALQGVLKTVREAHDLAGLARERAVREVAREMASAVVEAAFAADPDLFAARVAAVIDELQWERAAVRLGTGWTSCWERFEQRLSGLPEVASAVLDPALPDREVVLEADGLTLLLGMESTLTAAIDESIHGDQSG